MLLTRTPLYSRDCPHFLVRLACVKRAASVDSEPGSNSRLIFVSLNRSSFTQSSDESFLLASNQIFKDLRSTARISFDLRRTAGLETCGHRSAITDGSSDRKLKTFKKNQTGRPYSAPRGGPRGVLLPFLVQRVFTTYITIRHPVQGPFCFGLRFPSVFGDLPRISKTTSPRKRILHIFSVRFKTLAGSPPGPSVSGITIGPCADSGCYVFALLAPAQNLPELLRRVGGGGRKLTG